MSKEVEVTMTGFNVKTVEKKDTVNNVAVCKFTAELEGGRPAPDVASWVSDEFDRLTVSMEGIEGVKFEGLTTNCNADKGTVVYQGERSFDEEIDLETDAVFLALVKMKSAGSGKITGALSPKAGEEKLPL